MIEGKIGIGITTYKRPECLEICLEQIQAHTEDFEIFVYDDTKNKFGVAYGKNMCLKALSNCEHIFLFDDDCFPIHNNWTDWVINKAKETGQKHLLYLKDVGSIRCVKKEENGLCVFNNCGGAFMYLHHDCLEKVGGMNKDYQRYGLEHAGYSIRINKAGLTQNAFVSVEGMGEYIYSLDTDFWMSYNIDIKPSLIDEMDEMNGWLFHNTEVFKKDIEIIYQEL